MLGSYYNKYFTKTTFQIMDNHQNTDQLFKDYFEQRTLKPTDTAWDRLDTMLSVERPVTIRKRVPVYWLAACLVALVAALAVWRGQSVRHQLPATEVIAESPVPSLKTNESALTVSNEKEQPVKELMQFDTEKVKEHTSLKSGNYRIKDEQSADQITKITIAHDETLKSTKPIESNNEQDFQKVIASNPVTLEINAQALLASVEQLTPRQVASESKLTAMYEVRPDPYELLKEAEMEASSGLLKKLFKTLQSGSETIYTAWANRNYEEEQ